MIRDITIKAVLNGYVVQAGCQQLVFTSQNSLLSALGQYLKTPKEQELFWRARAINAKHTLSPELSRAETACQEVIPPKRGIDRDPPRPYSGGRLDPFTGSQQQASQEGVAGCDHGTI